MIEWNAVILAGGRARRLGGIDKTGLLFEGATLLDHAVAAVRDANEYVVVGGSSQVVEAPRYGGPAAATIAGLAELTPAPFTAVLAADQPLVASALPLLLAAVAVHGAVIAVDENGQRQPLLAIYTTEGLDRAGREPVENLSMRSLTQRLTVTELRLPRGLCADVDTPADARALGITVEELAHV